MKFIRAASVKDIKPGEKLEFMSLTGEKFPERSPEAYFALVKDCVLLGQKVVIKAAEFK